MTEISERYRRNSRRFLDKVAAVSPEQWDARTPCDDWTVRDLVQHVADTQGMFLQFVGREPADLPPLTGDPTATMNAAFGQIQDGLEDPEIAELTFEGMFGTQTFAAAVDRFLSFDLVVHGWDLARATGQDEEMDPAEVERLEVASKEFDASAMRGPQGFGPEISAPAGADTQTRVLAFLGREP